MPPSLKYSREITGDNGWLSPDGKFYDFNRQDSYCYKDPDSGKTRIMLTHADLAVRLGFNTEWEIERLGWIKRSRGEFITPMKYPTQAQVDVIFDFCQKNNLPMPEWSRTDNPKKKRVLNWEKKDEKHYVVDIGVDHFEIVPNKHFPDSFELKGFNTFLTYPTVQKAMDAAERRYSKRLETREGIKYGRNEDLCWGDEAWISPEGNVFLVYEDSSHPQVAEELGYTEYQLERLGWIKLSDGRFIYGEFKGPTQAQIDIIFDFCRENDLKMPDWAKVENPGRKTILSRSGDQMKHSNPKSASYKDQLKKIHRKRTGDDEEGLSTEQRRRLIADREARMKEIMDTSKEPPERKQKTSKISISVGDQFEIAEEKEIYIHDQKQEEAKIHRRDSVVIARQGELLRFDGTRTEKYHKIMFYKFTLIQDDGTEVKFETLYREAADLITTSHRL